jgi:hypothetical protein
VRPFRDFRSSAQEGVTTDTAKGEVESAAGVTETMRKGQQDPNIIRSPAWWNTRSTADGKPLKSGSESEKPEN